MLVAYAAHAFRLSRPMADGVPVREHLLAVQRATGIAPDELESPPIHDWLLYLWEWFVELHSGRAVGFGPCPLTWADIRAWALLTGRRPSPWEIHTIRCIDGAWLESQSKKK